ncbi:DNA-3-methyladenine glycosylase [Protopterus annectens]|uniref:DNA-3-methyladenine glycosylase n=1 Tax=Protopterus annectens TaxID=7888 RepID=UPI001CFBA03D|nr:DNA-3-methyladenine glycosylase [Protopterus annectens]XP_043945380.1 DNA-3-methyladenine glycosylase [Protopterus annectens]XP_043945381.1 DNA-3-methyladenine glycosylase [Protopterus annectens]
MAPRKRKFVTEVKAASQALDDGLPTENCLEKKKVSVVSSKYFTGKKEDSSRLESGFYNQPCISLAKALLGKIFVRRLADGTELRGRVVETEAYLGGEDKASHSFGGKQTERNVAMFMVPGTLYVYQIYGIYFCMNISSQGEGAAVLLRALEPEQGQDRMRELRDLRRKENGKALKEHELCNGPSKLCQALDINKRFDKRDLASDPDAWMEHGPEAVSDTTVSSARIGVNYGEEWAKKPLRFYIQGNKCVSVVDKVAEAKMNAGS